MYKKINLPEKTTFDLGSVMKLTKLKKKLKSFQSPSEFPIPLPMVYEPSVLPTTPSRHPCYVG
mgnify:FL=1